MASSSSFSSSSLISTDSLGALSFLKRFSPGRPLTQFPSFNSWCIQFCACSHENSFRKTILLFASSMMRVWGVQWTIHTPPHSPLCHGLPLPAGFSPRTQWAGTLLVILVWNAGWLWWWWGWRNKKQNENMRLGRLGVLSDSVLPVSSWSKYGKRPIFDYFQNSAS